MMNPFGIHSPQGRFANCKDIGAVIARVMVPWGAPLASFQDEFEAAKANKVTIIPSIVSHKTGNRDQAWLLKFVQEYMPPYVQVENEHWMLKGIMTMPQYIAHLNVSAQTVRMANPAAQVIAVGITSGSRSSAGMDSLVRMLSQHGHHDIADIHVYYGAPRELQSMTDFMRANGCETPLWCLETAGPMDAWSEAVMACEVVKRYCYGLAAGLKVICWSSLMPTLVDWPEPYIRLALLDRNEQQTPAYSTYKLMTKMLAGMTSISLVRDDVTAYRVERTGRPEMLVGWSDYGITEAVMPWKRVKVTQIPTERGMPADVYEKSRLFWKPSVYVDSVPIFVERN